MCSAMDTMNASLTHSEHRRREESKLEDDRLYSYFRYLPNPDDIEQMFIRPHLVAPIVPVCSTNDALQLPAYSRE